MKRTEKQVSISGLVEAMGSAGASFYFTEPGSLLVEHLERLPAYLADAFFDCNERELASFLRRRLLEPNGARPMETAS